MGVASLVCVTLGVWLGDCVVFVLFLFVCVVVLVFGWCFLCCGQVLL